VSEIVNFSLFSRNMLQCTTDVYMFIFARAASQSSLRCLCICT